MNLEELVELSGILPDLLTPTDVVLEPNEICYLEMIGEAYRAKRLWFRHLLLKEPLDSACKFTGASLYQPHAQIGVSFLELITGLHPRSEIVQMSGEDPLTLWYDFLVFYCVRDIANASPNLSILLDRPQHKFGKSESVKQAINGVKAYSKFICEEQINTPPKPPGAESVRSCAIPSGTDEAGAAEIYKRDLSVFLVDVAADIAKKDPQFDEDYFQPHSKTVSKQWNRINRCPELSVVWGSENGLHIGGKGKKAPKTRGKA